MFGSCWVDSLLWDRRPLGRDCTVLLCAVLCCAAAVYDSTPKQRGTMRLGFLFWPHEGRQATTFGNPQRQTPTPWRTDNPPPAGETQEDFRFRCDSKAKGSKRSSAIFNCTESPACVPDVLTNLKIQIFMSLHTYHTPVTNGKKGWMMDDG